MRKGSTYYHPGANRLVTYIGKGRPRIYWSGDMLSLLRREYPTTHNRDIAGMLRISTMSVVRKANDLGLKKDAEWMLKIRRERAFWARVANKKKGYPGGFKVGNTYAAEYWARKKKEE